MSAAATAPLVAIGGGIALTGCTESTATVAGRAGERMLFSPRGAIERCQSPRAADA